MQYNPIESASDPRSTRGRPAADPRQTRGKRTNNITRENAHPPRGCALFHLISNLI